LWPNADEGFSSSAENSVSEAALLKLFSKTSSLQNLRGEKTAQVSTAFTLETKDKKA
jgi:hypothetical protein